MALQLIGIIVAIYGSLELATAVAEGQSGRRAASSTYWTEIVSSLGLTILGLCLVAAAPD